jgi:hypothetical protein
MSSTTFLDICGLDFCSEDGGVKGGGRRVEDCFGVLAGRIVLAVGLVLAGGVVLAKASGFRARCVLIAASWCHWVLSDEALLQDLLATTCPLPQ